MIFTRLKAANRLNESLFMAALTLLCFGVSLFRFVYTDTKVFLFLNWNLFLAFVPWALTSLVVLVPKLQQSKGVLVGLLLAWLLFFPNAPYILTDLFHLRSNSSMPIWFDLILILSFAWTGLLFGFLSLWDIENMMKPYLSRRSILLSAILLLFIASFGIYVGRYLRWNSWDIIAEPLNLIYDISDRFVNPFAHPRTWGMTIFMGIFLNMIYLSFKHIQNRADKA
jgi:uncharacterized membrane protein